MRRLVPCAGEANHLGIEAPGRRPHKKNPRRAVCTGNRLQPHRRASVRRFRRRELREPHAVLSVRRSVRGGRRRAPSRIRDRIWLPPPPPPPPPWAGDRFFAGGGSLFPP